MIFVNFMKFFIYIFFFLLIQNGGAQDAVSHKCVDAVPVRMNKELFNLGLKKHLFILNAAEKGNGNTLAPQFAYPLWEADAYTAFGQNLQHSMFILCWFKKHKRAGLFFFEGYTFSQAQNFLETFEINFEDTHPLDDLLMYDGLLNNIKVYESFPRLEVLAKKANKK